MKRVTATIAVVLLCSLNALAGPDNPGTDGQPPDATPQDTAVTRAHPTQDPGVRKLSRSERREAIRNLEQKYRDFLDEVEPIILDDEENAFLVLETDAQRDLFIEDFWLRRDLDTATGRNEYEENYKESLERCKAEFKYVSSDRCRFMLIQGQPDEIIDFSCERYLQPLQIWIYGYLSGFGENAMFVFYLPKFGSDYRLWTPMGGRGSRESREELLSRDGEQAGYQKVFIGEVVNGMMTPPAIEMCFNGEVVMEALAKTEYNASQMTKVFQAPEIDVEGVDKIFQRVVMVDPDAPKVESTVTVTFPGKRGSRTATEIGIAIDRSRLTTKNLEGLEYYNIDVNGEILKDGKMFETFRYRYDFPVETVGDKVPVVIERFLRPADYTARIKIVDVNSNAQGLVEQKLEVPYIQESEERLAARGASSSALAAMQEEVRLGESRVRIVPLPDDILTGLQQIEVLVVGESVSKLEFYLDGKKIMTKRTPPYRLDLDFGDVPRTRNIRVVALDENDDVLGGDDITVNTGTDPFRVRIASPRVAMGVHGPTRVVVEAHAPEGKDVGEVELWFNETKLATLYDNPYVTTINIPARQSIGYIRAVARLKDEPDAAPVEDLVFINTPEFMQQIDVHLVELPTTVTDNRGALIKDLTESDFTVRDVDQSVELAKFEYVKDLPLSIGMAVDTSGSMRPRILEAQRTGVSFFRNVLRPGDKAFIIGFDTEPLVIQKWTDSLANMNAGLASMRAEEATALYDAIVYSLYNFKGIKGQKALVVISDGKDTASRFNFDQGLEYARRSAVPIYIIAIGIKSTEIDTRYKMGQFASETGGEVYYIDKAADLKKIYDTIHDELRSQYLLGFYPPVGVEPGDKWREVTVAVTKGTARTIAGYYP
jgi:Ca-activated chloride channel family protein